MSFDPRKMTVLLVEAMSTMRKIEIRTLKGLGFGKIIEAADAEAAINHLQTADAVDLIISDRNMPSKDGLELLLWVRSQERFKNVPCLMATGQGEKKQEQKAIDAGVNSFVAKPFHEGELKRKTDEAFGMGTQDALVDRGPREISAACPVFSLTASPVLAPSNLPGSKRLRASAPGPQPAALRA